MKTASLGTQMNEVVQRRPTQQTQATTRWHCAQDLERLTVQDPPSPNDREPADKLKPREPT